MYSVIIHEIQKKLLHSAEEHWGLICVIPWPQCHLWNKGILNIGITSKLYLQHVCLSQLIKTRLNHYNTKNHIIFALLYESIYIPCFSMTHPLYIMNKCTFLMPQHSLKSAIWIRSSWSIPQVQVFIRKLHHLNLLKGKRRRKGNSPTRFSLLSLLKLWYWQTRSL